MLFDQSSVQGILAGVKTQTRRVGDQTARFKEGDVIWVRETYKVVDGELFYRASTPAAHPDTNWKPSLFMPKMHTRIWLEVVGVRVERLQAITEADARAEGMVKTRYKHSLFGMPVWSWAGQKPFSGCLSPKSAYAARWDDLAKTGAKWEDNPLVTAIEFEPVPAQYHKEFPR